MDGRNLNWVKSGNIFLAAMLFLMFHFKSLCLSKHHYRKRSSPDVPAELAEKSSALVYARYVPSEISWGSKDKNFFNHFWLGIIIEDNLPVNLKQEV